jgi:hypothetical protein
MIPKLFNFFKNFIKNKIKLNATSYPMKIDAINHIMQEERTSNFSIPAYKLSLNELFILFQTDKASIYQNVIIYKKRYKRSLISGHNYDDVDEKISLNTVKQIDKIELFKSETMISDSRDTYLIMISKKFDD